MLVKRSGLILTRYVAIVAVAVFYTWLVLICGCGEDFWALNSVSSLKYTNVLADKHAFEGGNDFILNELKNKIISS